jgi:hypothetical protein
MSRSAARATTKVTFIDLEFDTTPTRGAPLGDIASSLVSLHDLLRDLASIAAHRSSVEFRDVTVVAIELRNPLKIKLSLRAISTEAVTAFQEICRDIIVRRRRSHQGASTARQRDDLDARQRANIKTALDLVLHADGKDDHITEQEEQRLHGHVLALHNAEVPLKRVIVKEE